MSVEMHTVSYELIQVSRDQDTEFKSRQAQEIYLSFKSQPRHWVPTLSPIQQAVADLCSGQGGRGVMFTHLHLVSR